MHLEQIADDAMANPEVLKELGRRALLPWYPNEGPQSDAFWSDADELLYGGEPGGGKSDLLIGLAVGQHRRSLLLRRLNAEVEGLVERAEQVLGSRDGYNSQKGIWRRKHSIIQFGGCQWVDDWKKYQGQPKDFLGFDELVNFLEHQYRAIVLWNRSVIPGQRVRVVSASNPPVTAEGQWVIRYWAPWLDENHPNPAVPGELRWFTSVGETGEEQDIEVDGPGPVMIDGEPLLDKHGKPILPKSRTFIPAELLDNPDLDESGYSDRLHTATGALGAMAKGDWEYGQQDDPHQVIPGEWVQAAMDRWHPGGGQGEMTCLSCDIAQGGPDQTVVARRYGGWFDNLVVTPGVDTKDGPAVAAIILMHMRDGCEVILDMGGGYGQSAYDHLRQTIDPTTFDASEGIERTDRTGRFTFYNLRAAAWWHLREALDPNFGSQLALPNDPVLKAELCSPKKTNRHGGSGKPKILIEAKEDIRKRLGTSTDRADAVIMAWWATGQRRQVGSGRGRSLPARAETSRGGGHRNRWRK